MTVLIRRRYRGAAGVVAAALCLAATSLHPALAAGGTFDLAQTIELVKREVAAAQAVAAEEQQSLRVDEAQLDFSLVEIAGRGGTRLAVPGADFAAGKENGRKPALRRHVAVDLAAPREAKSADAAETPDAARSVTAGTGTLARAISDLAAAWRLGLLGEPTFEAKRVALDLEFALDRDANGAPAVLVFVGDRRIDPRNVQKLRLKLSALHRGTGLPR
jgi:Trypsin-co-occurring domain 2